MAIQKEIIKLLQNGPQTEKQLRASTGTGPKKLGKILQLMTSEGKIKTGKKGYELAAPVKKNTQKRRQTVDADTVGIPARIVKLARSFAFAAPLDKSADIFIPGRGLMGAMPGDEVKVGLYAKPRVPGSREGEVVSVTKPNNRLVGSIENRLGRLFLVPDNAPDTPIAIQKGKSAGAVAGDKVAAEIVQRGARQEDHLAGVVLNFGAGDTAKQSAKAILYAAGIEKAFPEKVKEQAKYVSAQGIPAQEASTRLDLRDEVIFTIDSDSTKDIDDAISAARTKSGYAVGVHIADVSFYVQPKTPLDVEALHRGTSVYYADSVIPMLPKQLSNGICSLNPLEDRLAFSCLMQLDADGNLVDYKFEKTLIRSRVKGVYVEINALFEGSKSRKLAEKYAEVKESLGIMREIYEKLAALRSKRGDMEIESDEPKLVIDEQGKCVGVERRSRGLSERLIEEFMLLANNAAARFAEKLDIPFVYRVHEKPMEDKAAGLRTMLTAAGVPFKFKSEIPTQKELGKLLDDSRGTPLEKFVHNAVLRSMTKAKYEPNPKGHFGLALEDYAHFTSPIRRYPDLAIHRILSDVAQGMQIGEVRKKYKNFAQVASEQSSETELVAQRAERDCDACYKAEYMKPFMGKQFDGVISSVMQFGIYVELPNTVEGMVHVSRLPEEHLDLVEGVSLTNPLSGKSYRIGDAVQVVLVGVDIARGHIDFDLAQNGPLVPG